MSQPNAVAALLAMCSKDDLQDIARNEIASHELGCTCPFCEFVRSRYPAADADNPDEFARTGGEHQAYPFDAENTMALKSIATSLAVVAGTITSIRNILRGRDEQDVPIKSPLTAVVALLSGRAPVPPQGPSTQRTPAPVHQQAPQQSAPAQPVQQSIPYGAQQKRIATDAEMSRFKMDQKINFDMPAKWPKESQKGRIILANRGGAFVSEVDPEYLLIYADTKEYFGGKAKAKQATGAQLTADEQRDAQWGELNAAQYRRVAQDVMNGKVQRATVAPVQAYSGGADYD